MKTPLLFSFIMFGTVAIPGHAGETAGVTLHAPQAGRVINFNVLPADVHQIYSDGVARLGKVIDQIAAIPLSDVTPDATIKLIDIAKSNYINDTNFLSMLQMASDDPNIRKAVSDAQDALLTEYQLVMRKARPAVEAIEARANTTPLSEVDRGLLDHILLETQEYGAKVDQQKIGDLEKKLLDMRQRFNASLAGDGPQVADEEGVTYIVVSKERLGGLDTAYVQGLAAAGDGQVKLPLKDSILVVRSATEKALRDEVLAKSDNLPIKLRAQTLVDSLQVKQDIAQAIDSDKYKTYPDLVYADHAINDPRAVAGFFDKICAPLRNLADALKSRVLPLKQQDDATARDITGGDFRHYLKKLFNSFNSGEIMKYYEFENVLNEAFRFYEKGLNVTIRPVDVKGWGPDVRSYEVIDNKTGVARGRFFIDPYARQGKYTNETTLPLILGGKTESGDQRQPQAGILYQLAKPASGPVLMTLPQVANVFHELAHMLDGLNTQAQHGLQAGTNRKWDIVEVPSTAFQLLAGTPDILRQVSKHVDTGANIPPELLDQALESSRLLDAWATIREATIGALDLAIHLQVPKTVDELLTLARLTFDRFGFTDLASSPHEYLNIPHLMDGNYAASYAVYTIDRALALAIVGRFQAGPLEEVGEAFLHAFLKRGSSEDELRSLRLFTGTGFDPDHFSQSIDQAADNIRNTARPAISAPNPAKDLDVALMAQATKRARHPRMGRRLMHPAVVAPHGTAQPVASPH